VGYVYVITRWGDGEWGVVGLRQGRLSLLIEPHIRKGNVRADKGIPSVYKSISRLDPNLSNPRVGGSNPPGRVE